MGTIIRHLSNILDGARVILKAPTNQRKYKHVVHGFHQDQQKLREDIDTIGNDIQIKAKEAYGR
ncbi:hypothetical protein B9T31_16965 [Acinetobacter sp. ANC 4558]|uniref:hypothetical protein n=1 Tax=Acinetobacter sp. ANC 4558 TaxID=1977876 RepID=UPI000A3352B9|nr:hypothetical protein [Acinetobacter sp. ANC 4558]OTG79580.1 hypothetical protein B9T31_16965 [Acinetobacter sp. ANC 4558]